MIEYDLLSAIERRETSLAIADYLDAFLSTAGDHVSTLIGDLRNDVWSAGGTADPAAWYDWLKAIWTARGFEFGEIREGENTVTTLGGATWSVVVDDLSAPNWIGGPSSSDPNGDRQNDEFDALDLFRRYIDSLDPKGAFSLRRLADALRSDPSRDRLPEWGELVVSKTHRAT